MTLREIWRRITTSRYTQALETSAQMECVLREDVARQGAEIDRQGAEIDRLRAENRALLNSILGIAGLPPLPVVAPPALISPPSASGAGAGLAVHPAPPAPKPGGAAAIPMRRRSWQQINRILEFESAKKKESTPA